MRYLIPAVGHPDRPAFDVLALIASDRIAAEAARRGIAGYPNVNTRVVHTDRFGVPATINFEFVVTDAEQLDAAEAALHAALDSLKARPDATDLEKAQAKLRVAWYRTMRDASALGFAIGHFQTMDSWRTLPAYLRGRDETDAGDIARLASTYFVPENRSVGIARPTASGTGSQTGATP